MLTQAGKMANGGRLLSLGLLLAGLLPTNVLAGSEACTVIRDAASHTMEAARVRMRQVLQLSSGVQVQREWRLIGDRRYSKQGHDSWVKDERPNDWMQMRGMKISNCKRADHEVIDGAPATVWAYSRDLEGERGTVKMWVDETSSRILRTYVEFEPSKSRYRQSDSRFDYSNDIERPE